jgi:molybdate/tungstate transport system substrate-binding protein
MKKIIILLALISLTNCSKENIQNSDTISGRVIIFHAGSLSLPFKEIIEEFNVLHPDLEILTEIAGSRACARKISELNKPCDVFASADYTVINNLLIPEHAEWNIKFVSNEMAIVFHDESKYSDEITADNWYKILQKDDAVFARSNPDADPCGYRTVLTIKLAEKYYGQTDLSEILLEKNMEYIRPKETDLLALLEVNEIDYIFLYKSVALQHGLRFINLPDQVNLRTPQFADLYSTVSVDLSGTKPGEIITKFGEPMVYGITIPKSSPNQDAALAFVSFVLSTGNGMKILEENGQPGIVPAVSETYDSIPEALKHYVLGY